MYFVVWCIRKWHVACSVPCHYLTDAGLSFIDLRTAQVYTLFVRYPKMHQSQHSRLRASGGFFAGLSATWRVLPGVRGEPHFEARLLLRVAVELARVPSAALHKTQINLNYIIFGSTYFWKKNSPFSFISCHTTGEAMTLVISIPFSVNKTRSHQVRRHTPSWHWIW